MPSPTNYIKQHDDKSYQNKESYIINMKQKRRWNIVYLLSYSAHSQDSWKKMLLYNKKLICGSNIWINFDLWIERKQAAILQVLFLHTWGLCWSI